MHLTKRIHFLADSWTIGFGHWPTGSIGRVTKGPRVLPHLADQLCFYYTSSPGMEGVVGGPGVWEREVPLPLPPPARCSSTRSPDGYDGMAPCASGTKTVSVMTQLIPITVPERDPKPSRPVTISPAPPGSGPDAASKLHEQTLWGLWNNSVLVVWGQQNRSEYKPHLTTSAC